MATKKPNRKTTPTPAVEPASPAVEAPASPTVEPAEPAEPAAAPAAAPAEPAEPCPRSDALTEINGETARSLRAPTRGEMVRRVREAEAYEASVALPTVARALPGPALSDLVAEALRIAGAEVPAGASLTLWTQDDLVSVEVELPVPKSGKAKALYERRVLSGSWARARTDAGTRATRAFCAHIFRGAAAALLAERDQLRSELASLRPNLLPPEQRAGARKMERSARKRLAQIGEALAVE